MSQTVLVYTCGPSVITPSAHFYSKKCRTLDSKFYLSHLSDKNYGVKKAEGLCGGGRIVIFNSLAREWLTEKMTFD